MSIRDMFVFLNNLSLIVVLSRHNNQNELPFGFTCFIKRTTSY